ncbi:hypothetical protein OKW21_003443 [Catalinimonas alkaloidigena]|nr:hypothetical protein [Catalinimonas alkaloidigena]
MPPKQSRKGYLMLKVAEYTAVSVVYMLKPTFARDEIFYEKSANDGLYPYLCSCNNYINLLL